MHIIWHDRRGNHPYRHNDIWRLATAKSNSKLQPRLNHLESVFKLCKLNLKSPPQAELLANLQDQCAEHKKQAASRSALQADELQAISEAQAILQEDESQEAQTGGV